MGDRLKDKVAIVTGAGRGIGRGHALALAAEGAKVVVNDLGGAVDGTGTATSPADEVVAEIKKRGGTAVANYESVTTWEGAEKIIKTAIDNFGKLDILVNNAGILRDRMVFNMTKEEWDAVIAVHLDGTFNCTRHACTIFRQQKSGRIINTSSQSGIAAVGQANYAAVKEGINGFTRCVARDMGRYGVTCNAIRPGGGTRMIDLAQAQRPSGPPPPPSAGPPPARPPGPKVAWMERPRIGGNDPENVAPFVVWLCSDQAAHINGYVFDASGGHIILYPEPTPTRNIFKFGRWTVDELVDIIPKTLTHGLENPSPPAPPKG